MNNNIGVYIIYVSLIIFSNLHTPVRESHGKGTVEGRNNYVTSYTTLAPYNCAYTSD